MEKSFLLQSRKYRAAGGLIGLPQSARLRDRELQARHLVVFAAYAIDQPVRHGGFPWEKNGEHRTSGSCVSVR
jgi:hypothetical protein